MKRKQNRNNAEVLKSPRWGKIECQVFGRDYVYNVRITKVEALHLIEEMDNNDVDSSLICFNSELYRDRYALLTEAQAEVF